MTSRFSTLHKRGDAPANAGRAAASERSRGVHSQRAQAGAGAAAGTLRQKTSNRVLDARIRIHRMLLEEINLVALERLPKDEMRRQVHEFVSEKTREERMAINVAELDALVDDIVDEMVGLGPLEPLLKDPEINDILINGHENCFVERKGKLQKVHIPFKDEAHLLADHQQDRRRRRPPRRRIAADGRRAHARRLALQCGDPAGRRRRAAGVDPQILQEQAGLSRLVEFGAITQNMAEVLAAAVHARKTTIISGGTGTGKTTMLNALSAFIPEDERLITIEDAAELQLQQPHVARMETRPANIEGHGELKQRDLVKNALRMRPDRVILGECRGEEAFDMLQAMNTGHEGSMATIHANTPRDAISRLEQMLGMTGMPMTVQSIRSQIASAIEIIVQLTRLSDGKRKVTSVAEVTGMEGDVIQMQEIFRFVRTGMDGRRHDPRPFRGDGPAAALPRGSEGHGHRIPGHLFRARQAAGVSGDVRLQPARSMSSTRRPRSPAS